MKCLSTVEGYVSDYAQNLMVIGTENSCVYVSDLIRLKLWYQTYTKSFFSLTTLCPKFTINSNLKEVEIIISDVYTDNFFQWK